MFLAELLRNARVTDQDIQQGEIPLILAGCRAGADYSLVTTRTAYEEVLVKYRASEPASEAILMALGSSKEKSDPIWDAMLQNEMVASTYSRLCNEFHVSRLSAPPMSSESAVLQKEEPQVGEIDNPTEEVEPLTTTAVEGDAGDGISGEEDIPTETSINEEATPTEMSLVEDAEDDDSSEDEVSDTSDDEDKSDFFANVQKEDTEGDEGVGQLEVSDDAFGELPEEQDVGSLPSLSTLIKDMQEEGRFIPHASTVTPSASTSEDEVKSEKDYSGVALTEIPDDDYFPEGIMPDEETQAEKQVQETLVEHTEESAEEVDAVAVMEKAESILQELHDLFAQYGIKNVCVQVGTSFDKFLQDVDRSECDLQEVFAQFGGNAAEVPVQMFIVDAVIERMKKTASDILAAGGNDSMNRINNLLGPVIKILYEE